MSISEWDGRPENSDQPGWHWLSCKGAAARPWEWCATYQEWVGTVDSYTPSSMVEFGWGYEGPCYKKAVSTVTFTLDAKVLQDALDEAWNDLMLAQCRE